MEFMPSDNEKYESDSAESNVEEEEQGEESNEDQMEEAPPKRRRMAGDRSGRQLALRRLQKEDSNSQGSENMPSFIKAMKEARAVFSSFQSGDTAIEDQASAMRNYLSRKYGVSTKVSLRHIVISHFHCTHLFQREHCHGRKIVPFWL